MIKTSTSILVFILTLAGCASKPSIVYKTVEVKVPIKCEIEKLNKPKYDGSFESAKHLTIYYLNVEHLLKQCSKEKE